MENEDYFTILQDDIKRLRAHHLQDLLNRGFAKQFAYVVAMQTTARFMRSMWRVL